MYICYACPIYYKYISFYISLLRWLNSFIDNQLTRQVYVYIWTLFYCINLFVYFFTNSYRVSWVILILQILFQDILATLDLLYFHIHFRISSSIFLKLFAENLIETALNLNTILIIWRTTSHEYDLLSPYLGHF